MAAAALARQSRAAGAVADAVGCAALWHACFLAPQTELSRLVEPRDRLISRCVDDDQLYVQFNSMFNANLTLQRPCRRPDERLDWMYGGGMVAQMDAEKRSEQALLGERLPDATDQPAEVRRCFLVLRRAALILFVGKDRRASSCHEVA